VVQAPEGVETELGGNRPGLSTRAEVKQIEKAGSPLTP